MIDSFNLLIRKTNLQTVCARRLGLILAVIGLVGLYQIREVQAETPPLDAFYPAVNYSVGSNPISAAVGDFNGDGSPDFAVANQSSGNVSVLMNNGDGSFQAAVNYSVGSRPTNVAAGDFNGDGSPDLAVSNGDSNNVSVLLNNGEGSFQPAVNYSVGNNPNKVAVGDFDGDGRYDLAVANFYSSSVSFHFGNSDGTFKTGEIFSFYGMPYDIAVGDLNGDSKLDIAIAMQLSERIEVFFWDSSYSGWDYGGQYSMESVPSYIAAGDLNSDGKPDLAVADWNNKVYVLLNTGSGSFSTAGNYPNYLVEGGHYKNAAAGDFNGDGNLDLILGNSVLLNSGGGSFQPAQNLSVGSSSYSTAVGDFNGDGKPDLAVTNWNSNNVSVHLSSPPLGSLTVSIGSLNPSFAPDITDYTVHVDNSVTSINITGTTDTSSATMTINGQYAGNGTQTVTVNVNPGDNFIPIVVTTGGGAVTKTYTVNVIRSLSTNASLSSINAIPGLLTPDFNSNTVVYQVYNEAAVNSLDITAVTADPYALVKINGQPAISSAAHSVYLGQGANLIPIVVTAHAGNEKAYIISVNGTVSDADLRSLSSSAGSLGFDPDTTSYIINVDNGVTNLDITAVPSDHKAIVLVNGAIHYEGTDSVSLNPGVNTIKVMVVAQDASTKTYTITVNRAEGNADLGGLAVTGLALSPGFNPETVTYEMYVSNNTASLDITAIPSDSAAAVTISGQTQSAGGSVTVPLNLGINTIPVVVSATDGSTKKTYTLIVNRGAALLITTYNLPAAVQGMSYSTVIEAVGGSGTYTWSAVGLPAGLNLDAATGAISGNPLIAGSSQPVFTTIDSNGITVSQALTLTVNPPEGTGNYTVTPVNDPAYTSNEDAGGIAVMTVKNNVNGFKYFTVNVSPVESHSGSETIAFVQYRNGAQVNVSATKADYDIVVSAQAGFNVKPGDIIKAFIVDTLTNDPDFNPTPL